jgi:ferritin
MIKLVLSKYWRIAMLKKEIVELLNEQINKELFSAYLYLEIANYYGDEGLEGYENWFKIQALEEEDHAMLIRQYLLNNGHAIKLKAIDDPTRTFNNYKEPLEAALEHERYVTDSIHTIYSLAAELKDYRTMQFLDWFIAEQGEEETNAEENIRNYQLFEKNLYSLNKELKKREHTPPSFQLD